MWMPQWWINWRHPPVEDDYDDNFLADDWDSVPEDLFDCPDTQPTKPGVLDEQ
jgi:hypothetical protein